MTGFFKKIKNTCVTGASGNMASGTNLALASWRAAVDTGDTFTDICILKEDTGQVYVAKVSSTPFKPSLAIMEGLTCAANLAGVDMAGLRLLLHGTTVAANALLEGTVDRTALITTKGFKDILYIGRQNRPKLYDFHAAKPTPLIPRRFIFEINERILADGNVLIPVEEAEIEAIAACLQEMEITSVAVCLLHSYANPAHEQMIRKVLSRFFPEVMVSLSSDILPEFREYERTCTTVINALVQPKVASHLRQLKLDLKVKEKGAKLFVLQSNGGLLSAAQAQRESARIVLSGSAGGVLAGMQLARQTGRANIITMDMGGTSTDISLIQAGESHHTTKGQIGGHPLCLPMLDIHTIGAGGGSIAWIDRGGTLQVGPQSAGANPGPACYALGGQWPTVTDANLVLGRLNPDIILRQSPNSQSRKLDLDKACTSIEINIARPLGITVEQAAEGIITVVNSAMARALRVVSVYRGYDPRDFTLMAFGGNGPLHAAQLAEELGMPHVLIPRYPGATSALGMLTADIRRDYAHNLVLPLLEIEPAILNEIFGNLEAQGQKDISNGGFPAVELSAQRTANLRYAGQTYEINMPVPCGRLGIGDLKLLERSFHLAHQKEYGSLREGLTVELVSLRVVILGRLPGSAPFNNFKGLNLKPVKTYDTPKSKPTTMRNIYLFESYTLTPVYNRTDLHPGDFITGPALIEQNDSTTLLLPNMRLHTDTNENLILEVRAK